MASDFSNQHKYRQDVILYSIYIARRKVFYTTPIICIPRFSLWKYEFSYVFSETHIIITITTWGHTVCVFYKCWKNLWKPMPYPFSKGTFYLVFIFMLVYLFMSFIAHSLPFHLSLFLSHSDPFWYQWRCVWLCVCVYSYNIAFKCWVQKLFEYHF